MIENWPTEPMEQKARILVVDDSSEELSLLVKLLTAEGYGASPADSGELALSAATSNPPDLILLDVRMAGMDAFAVCRRLKEAKETRHIPIILLIAYADTEEWMTGMKLGAADYITKPFKPAELLTRIRIHLSLSRAKESLARESVAVRESNERLESEIVARQTVENELRANLLRAERSRKAMLSALEDQKRAEKEKDRLAEELQQIRTMETVGRLAGGIAHDFNNMLSVILGQVELVLDKVTQDDPAYAGLVEIKRAAKRSAELTRQLLAYARMQTASPELLDLNKTLSGILTALRQPPHEGMEIALQPGTGLWTVKVDPTQVAQILTGLSVDAQRVLGSTGKITMETQNIALDQAYCVEHPGSLPGEYVRLRVRHETENVDNDALSHIFEPFFTTTSVGKGLGLATAYGIIKQNRGFLDVYSEDQQTTFSVYLPRHDAGVASPRIKDTRKPTSPATPTILLVDDEPAILGMATIMLESHGYAVIAASSPVQAIRLAREHGDEIDLLFTDVVMPEMNGRDLARSLLAFYPHLKCLFMSGYTADVIAINGIVDEELSFIQKPFSDSQLSEKVEEALRREQQT